MNIKLCSENNSKITPIKECKNYEFLKSPKYLVRKKQTLQKILACQNRSIIVDVDMTTNRSVIYLIIFCIKYSLINHMRGREDV